MVKKFTPSSLTTRLSSEMTPLCPARVFYCKGCFHRISFSYHISCRSRSRPSPTHTLAQYSRCFCACENVVIISKPYTHAYTQTNTYYMYKALKINIMSHIYIYMCARRTGYAYHSLVLFGSHVLVVVRGETSDVIKNGLPKKEKRIYIYIHYKNNDQATSSCV